MSLAVKNAASLQRVISDKCIRQGSNPVGSSISFFPHSLKTRQPCLFAPNTQKYWVKKKGTTARAVTLYATGDQTGAGAHEWLTYRHRGFQEHTQEKVRPA